MNTEGGRGFTVVAVVLEVGGEGLDELRLVAVVVVQQRRQPFLDEVVGLGVGGQPGDA